MTQETTMPTVRTLADYRPQHDLGCGALLCAGLVSSLKLPCQLGDWSSHVAARAGHDFVPGACTCGLEALLSAQGDGSGQGINQELLEAAKRVASFAVSWQPLSPGDIRELKDAILKAEGSPTP